MQPQSTGFGLIRGPGTGTSDSIPAALSDGEVVIPAEKVRAFGAKQIMTLVDEGGLGVKKPPVKHGRVHAATGGLIEDPDELKRQNPDGSVAAPSPALAASPPPAAVSSTGPIGNAATAGGYGVAAPPAAPVAPQIGPSGASQIPTSPGTPLPQPTVAAQPDAAPAYLGAVGGAANLASSIPSAMPAASAGAAPPANLGLVTRQGNSYSGANVRGDASINGEAAGGGFGLVGTPGVTSADRIAQYQRDGQHLQDLTAIQRRIDVNNGQGPGLAVIDDAAAQAQAHAQRGGFGVTGGQRARMQQLGLRDAGETQRALIQEQGVDARTRAQTAFQQQQLGLEGKKVALDASREDRAASASAADQAQKARLAQLQDQVVNGNPLQQRRAAEQLAALQGREITGNQPPAGYRRTADGNLEAIKGGPADPAVRGSRAPLNDTQSKALQFGTRMQVSGELLDKLAEQGVDQPGLIKRGADAVGAGSAANWTQSPEQQQVEQAQRDFVNATLRRESGAAISNGEFDNARKQYFPQVGDSPEVIKQKRANREIATRGILAEVPDAETRVAQVRGPSAPVGAPGAAPAAAALPSGMTRQVGTSGGKPVYEDGNGRRFLAG